MRRRIKGVLIAAGLLAAVACSGSSETGSRGETAEPTQAPATTGDKGGQVDAPGIGAIEWDGCGDTAECGTLEVPVDYDDASAGTLDLGLIRLPAGDPDRRIGALLVNPGGPGGTGVDFARYFPFPDEIADRFDIIGFDPRGVGSSAGLTCGGDLVDQFFALDSDPDAPTEQVQLDQSAQAVAADCGAENGDLLAHVGSVNVVRDMDSIRQALDEDQISYLGFSYGTLLGALYADMFPDRVRAVVLDGVVDPAHDFREWLAAQAAGFDRAVAAMFAACPEDDACPEGGAAAAYDQILARVETDPLPAGDGHVLGPGDLATAALYATYDPLSWTELYMGLSDALAGDGGQLYSMADNYRAFGAFTQYAAVVCVDSPHPVGAAEFRSFAAGVETISPRLGAAVANELLTCAFWPVDEVGDPQPVTAAGAPPVLVVGNTGDAATPYEQAQRVAETLESGVLLTYEGEGHTSYLGKSNCVDDAIHAYLLDLTVPAEGTVCD